MKGHVYKQAPGKFWIVLELGKDENHKRKQRFITFYGKKKEADAELLRHLKIMESGSYVEPSTMTVGDYLDSWLSDHVRHTVTPRTFERYRSDRPAPPHPRTRSLHARQAPPHDDPGALGTAAGDARLADHGAQASQRASCGPGSCRSHEVADREPRRRRHAAQATPPRDEGPGRGRHRSPAGGLRRARRSASPSCWPWRAACGAVRSSVCAGRTSTSRRGRSPCARPSRKSLASSASKGPKTPRSRRVIALPSVAVEALRQHRAEAGGGQAASRRSLRRPRPCLHPEPTARHGGHPTSIGPSAMRRSGPGSMSIS